MIWIISLGAKQDQKFSVLWWTNKIQVWTMKLSIQSLNPVSLSELENINFTNERLGHTFTNEISF
jgi:hypothetical protein